ncbi:MAG: MarR family transcriptional regulator [Calditrichia bacterium]
MSTPEKVKEEMLQDFAEAYRSFGLSKLMGRVVALLIYSNQPLSLDDIAQNLEMSKGPISQITRRLSDRNLIRKIWVPGDRKDYYEMTAELFENAFKNNFSLIQNNTKIARQLREKVEQTNDESLNVLKNRLVEMENFYQLMEKHFQNFLDEWVEKRSEIYQNQ